MAYINNKKFKEIREAAKSGNEKALEILQGLRKGSSQEDLNRLVDKYYEIPVPEPIVVEKEEEEYNEYDDDDDNDVNDNEEELTLEPEQGVVTEESVTDLTSVLDGELDGIIDENEIDEIGFSDFLKNKLRDAKRSKRGADYFRAFDPEGRKKYMADKINGYKGKFDNRLKNVDRKYNDITSSMGTYMQSVNDSLDDGIEIDTAKISQAYDDFIGDENAMNSFGRYWDKNDNEIIINKLKELMANYGKQNIVAALNALNSDNTNYRDFLNNQIDSEISRYSKSIEGLLK